VSNILLAGSSGLVGGLTLTLLLNDKRVEKIILVSRSAQKLSNPKIIQIISSLDLLDTIDLKDYGIEKLDAGLCALGSTIKKAGSKEDFKKIDCDFVINVAKFSKKNGVNQFAVISALGADSHSSIFYNQVKGEMEEALKSLNFNSLSIFRPSLILGERKEVRTGERFLIKISPFLNATLMGPLKKYRGIEAHRLAKHLVDSIFTRNIGVKIIENAEMLNI
jgi:uncharacterized protein YbjT (DUF2867 family)